MTPVVRSSTLDQLAQRQLLFKCELLQKTGSFKARGACNACLKLPESVRTVVTHSSGNHAAALAWAAAATGRTAHIVMPKNAPAIKKIAVLGYGAKITSCEPTNLAREQGAAAICAETGGAMVHPSNDPDVIAGQGTVGLELLQQAEEVWPESGGLDCIIAPIGGGGLVGGIAAAVKGLRGQAVKVIAAEPELADDAYRSKLENTICGHKCASGQTPDTIADGLKTTLGPNTFPLIRDLVDDIITVSEEEIASATRLIWERMKLAIEPSAGVGVAVALSSRFRERHRDCTRVGVVLCGGNCDILKVAPLLAQAKPFLTDACAESESAKRARLE